MNIQDTNMYLFLILHRIHIAMNSMLVTIEGGALRRQPFAVQRHPWDEK